MAYWLSGPDKNFAKCTNLLYITFFILFIIIITIIIIPLNMTIIISLYCKFYYA